MYREKKERLAEMMKYEQDMKLMEGVSFQPTFVSKPLNVVRQGNHQDRLMQQALIKQDKIERKRRE